MISTKTALSGVDALYSAINDLAAQAEAASAILPDKGFQAKMRLMGISAMAVDMAALASAAIILLHRSNQDRSPL